MVVEESLITEEMRSRVGAESGDMILEIEKGMVKKLVEAMEDANPLWQDEEYAKKTVYGGLIAPPNLLCTLLAGAGVGRVPVKTPYPRRGFPSGEELELFQPVRVGDVITARAKLADIHERVGKDGTRRLFIIVETTYKNQKGELVAKNRSNTMSMKRGQA